MTERDSAVGSLDYPHHHDGRFICEGDNMAQWHLVEMERVSQR